MLLGLLVVGALIGLPAFEFASAGATRHADRALQELTLEDNDSRHKIAVLEVEGIISSQPWDRSGRNMIALLKDQLELAQEDRAVRAIILKVDSPGGEVLASDDMARLLKRFQKESAKPVVVSMGSLAASGGYYISAPCRWIVANELTITGSIGVIMQSLNYRGLMDKVGLHPQVFKSGRFKDMLSGTKNPGEIDPAETAMIQEMVNETFAKFKAVVAEGRADVERGNPPEGRPLAPNWADFADGRVMSGKQAFDLGFVDELGTFETAVDRAKAIASIEDADLIRYRPVFDIADVFGMFGRTETKTIKVDMGMEMPRLQTGRMYFLSPTYVQ